MKRLLCLAVLILLASQGMRIARADCASPSFRALVPFATGAAPKTIINGDFNQDGKLDLAVGQNTNIVSVFINRSSVSNFIFDPPVTYNVNGNPVYIVVEDFTQDGKLDIATANRDGGTVALLNGDGTGVF